MSYVPELGQIDFIAAGRAGTRGGRPDKVTLWLQGTP